MHCPASWRARARKRRLRMRRSKQTTFWFAIAALLAALPALASEIVTREFDSAALGRKWAYEVYIPTPYQTSRANYPVLYLLHGNNGTGRDWVEKGKIQRTADALIANGEIPAAIIVMPDAG